MKTALARGFLISFLAIVLAAAWYQPLESLAAPQIDAGLKRALVSFATARTLNAIMSTIQSTQLTFQPFGVGTSVAPGQMLRPLNELIAQFAELMLAASIAFGVMKILIGIGSFWAVSLLMSAFALVWVRYRWHGRRAPFWVEKALFALLFVRFAMPVVTVGSDAVFERFMHRDYTESQEAIEGNRGELMTLVPTIDEAHAGKRMVEQMKAWWSRVDVAESLRKIQQGANRAVEHIVTLIVVFLLQTLVIPLLLFWAFYKISKAVIYAPPARRPFAAEAAPPG